MITIEVIKDVTIYILVIAGLIFAICVALAVVYFCTELLLPSIPPIRRLLNRLGKTENEEELLLLQKERSYRVDQYRKEYRRRKHQKIATTGTDVPEEIQ